MGVFYIRQGAVGGGPHTKRGIIVIKSGVIFQGGPDDYTYSIVPILDREQRTSVVF